MDYKELFKITLEIIVSPAKFWNRVLISKNLKEVQSFYFYPMMGITALFLFVSSLISKWAEYDRNVWGASVKTTSITIITLLAGFFFSSYAISVLRKENMNRSIILIGYSYSVIFLATIFSELLPSMSFLISMMQVYVCYVLWEGCVRILNISENERLRYTIISTLLVVFSPLIINKIIGFAISQI